MFVKKIVFISALCLSISFSDSKPMKPLTAEEQIIQSFSVDFKSKFSDWSKSGPYTALPIYFDYLRTKVGELIAAYKSEFNVGQRPLISNEYNKIVEAIKASGVPTDGISGSDNHTFLSLVAIDGSPELIRIAYLLNPNQLNVKNCNLGFPICICKKYNKIPESYIVMFAIYMKAHNEGQLSPEAQAKFKIHQLSVYGIDPE